MLARKLQDLLFERPGACVIPSLALSQDRIPNALCVIVTIARSHTEVRRLRLDGAGDSRFCAGTAPLRAARGVVPG